MSMMNNDPDTSIQEASIGVSQDPAASIPANAPPPVGSEGQTTEDTAGSKDPNPVSVNPPVAPISNAASSTASSLPSLNSGNGNRMNQEQLKMDALEKDA